MCEFIVAIPLLIFVKWISLDEKWNCDKGIPLWYVRATSPPSLLPTLTSYSLPHMICSQFPAESLFPFPSLLCKYCCLFLEYHHSSSPLLSSSNHSPSGGESAQVSTLPVNILWFLWVSAWSCYHSTLSFPLP